MRSAGIVASRPIPVMLIAASTPLLASSSIEAKTGSARPVHSITRSSGGKSRAASCGVVPSSDTQRPPAAVTTCALGASPSFRSNTTTSMSRARSTSAANTPIGPPP